MAAAAEAAGAAGATAAVAAAGVAVAAAAGAEAKIKIKNIRMNIGWRANDDEHGHHMYVHIVSKKIDHTPKKKVQSDGKFANIRLLVCRK